MAAAVTVSTRAGAVFLDFATAFPSLAHGWLFSVMTAAGLPEAIIRVVIFLYSKQVTYFMVAGELVAEVALERGVKQGCPLSGTLFAMAVDPLLRRLAQGPGPLQQWVFAYADDLAIVFRALCVGLARLLPVFVVWGRISGLRLRPDKSVVVPLCARPFAEVRRELAEVSVEAGEMSIQPAARYLGVVLGPEASEQQWNSVVPKLLPRARDVFHTGRGLPSRLLLFRTHVASMIQFKFQFVAASSVLVAAFRRALQSITGAPWMALPPIVLEEGRTLGFAAAAPEIETMQRATLVRAAFVEQRAVAQAEALLNEAATSDDCLLVPAFSRFRRELIAIRWRVE